VSIVRKKSIEAALLGCLVTAAIVIYAFLSQSPQPVGSQSSTLLVAAAASLQPALREIQSRDDRSSGTDRVKYNFGSSGALQQQIEQGAPIDLFISASSKQMKALEQQNLLVPNTQKNLLTNRLVLITAKTSTRKLTDFRQLVQPEIQRIAIGEPRSVPVGQYAIQTFTNLGILERVKSKFVLANNVRAVLAAVETGDADAGIVYISDAKSSDRVVVSAIANARLHAPIIYPVAILKSSRSIASAKKYIEFLQTKPVQGVFKKYGFGIAKP
jgi:molybdate transport system substrate-binding protein